jgi:hypothetical protein
MAPVLPVLFHRGQSATSDSRRVLRQTLVLKQKHNNGTHQGEHQCLSLLDKCLKQKSNDGTHQDKYECLPYWQHFITWRIFLMVLGFSVAILQNKNKSQKNCQISISTFQ